MFCFFLPLYNKRISSTAADVKQLLQLQGKISNSVQTLSCNPAARVLSMLCLSVPWALWLKLQWKAACLNSDVFFFFFLSQRTMTYAQRYACSLKSHWWMGIVLLRCFWICKKKCNITCSSNKSQAQVHCLNYFFI